MNIIADTGSALGISPPPFMAAVFGSILSSRPAATAPSSSSMHPFGRTLPPSGSLGSNVRFFGHAYSYAFAASHTTPWHHDIFLTTIRSDEAHQRIEHIATHRNLINVDPQVALNDAGLERVYSLLCALEDEGPYISLSAAHRALEFPSADAIQEALNGNSPAPYHQLKILEYENRVALHCARSALKAFRSGDTVNAFTRIMRALKSRAAFQSLLTK